MKIVKLTVVALLATLFTTGCVAEKISFSEGESATISDKGLLSLADLAVDCRVDDNDPNMGILSTKATRSSVNIDEFECQIIDSNNEVINSFKFGERPTEAIEMKTGDYIFKIQSGNIPGAEFDAPAYGAVKPFKIVRNETTTLSEVVCSLLQIKVSVTYAPDLFERLGEQTVTTVTVGENSLVFSLTESRAGFFLAPLANNTIELSIKGTYAADKVNFKPLEMNKEVTNVKVGQHSKVHFYIEHAAQGNIEVGVTLRDWVTDEIIPCNVADKVAEEEWKDPSSGDDNEGGEVIENPITVEWIGYDMSQRVTIDPTTTGEIIIRAEKGIKELIVHIDSPALAPILSSVGLVDVINLSYPEKSYDYANPQTLTADQVDLLKNMLKPASEGGLLGFKYGDDVINQTEVLFSITDFMVPLSAFAGDHNFHFTITDNDGNTAKPSLMLKSNGL
ncbi:MAG: DUF4493 domain-containing protein [Alistipes sp.]|nr:DUF4493 domain-containing protein [Alistipes sp.]